MEEMAGSGEAACCFQGWIPAIFLLVAGLLFSGPATAQQTGGPEPVVAYAARMVADDARTRIVVDFESAPEFNVRYLAAPARIVVEFPDAALGFSKDALEPRGFVRAVRYGKSGRGRSLLVLTLSRPAQVVLAELRNMEGGRGTRLVLDASVTDDETFAELVAQSSWSNDENRDEAAPSNASPQFTVVVDAGHGGIDSGAEGGRGTKEKRVTLAFAKALRDALGNVGGIEVVMTRTDDTFISLSGRLRIAHKAAADLFVSVHADSIAVRGLRGATVYTLSDKASDAVARELAEQENREDVVIGEALESAPESVAGILVDLARRESRIFSTGLAQRILASFEGQVRLINNPHRHAGFRVLQAPDVPSVLVELGYLSNVEDEKLLNDAAWRASTAELLALSIEKYKDGNFSRDQ